MRAEADARAVEGAAEATDGWKSTWRLVDRRGDDAICVHVRRDGSREFVLASGYDERTGRWGSGEYFDSLASAAAKLENRAISSSDEVILADFWCRDDIRSALGEEGLPVTEENVDAVMESLGLDGRWDSFGNLKSPLSEELCTQGNEVNADEVSYLRERLEASDGVEMDGVVAPTFDMCERDCPIDDGVRDER